jgi:hypothetical protein
MSGSRWLAHRGLSRRDCPTFNFFDDNLLDAAMREVLAHDTGFDRPLQRQSL